jgi:hypothetical protein
MRAIVPGPNLLLVGGPKSGTTSLLLWLRKHPEIYHPWQRHPSGAWESGFLLGGVSDNPYEPSNPKGTLLLPNETDMDYYRREPFIIDKSPQHLYSPRALATVRDLLPDSKVVITLRDPYDLLISLFHQMKKTAYYNTSFDELISMMDNQDWTPDSDIAETWSFLSYPQFSSHVKSWVNEIGPDRVKVIPLQSIATDSRKLLDELSDWLGLDPSGMPSNLSVKNPRGQLSNSPIRKFLREPPSWAFRLSHILMPSRQLRKRLLDPIRRMGWKHIPTKKYEVPQELQDKIRARLSTDIEFFENLEKYIPTSTIIR